MWKLMTGDGPAASRTALIPHAVSATCLLFAGLLVVGLAQMGGGASTSPLPRTFVSGCSSSSAQSTTFTNVANKLGYYTPTTATVTKYRTVTRTLTKTRTVTRTITYYRTRTKTVCQATTVTGPGSTTTVTSNSTTTETTTAPGSTTTTTVFATLSGSSSASAPAFTCPPEDGLGFPVGVTDYTSDPIFCSYPAVPGEDPNDFYCTYSAITGVLVTDNDAGLCPATAVATGP